MTETSPLHTIHTPFPAIQTPVAPPSGSSPPDIKNGPSCPPRQGSVSSSSNEADRPEGDLNGEGTDDSDGEDVPQPNPVIDAQGSVGFRMVLSPDFLTRAYLGPDYSLALCMADLLVSGGFSLDKISGVLSAMLRGFGGEVGAPFSDRVWHARHSDESGGPDPILVFARASTALRIFSVWWTRQHRATQARLVEMPGLLAVLAVLADQVSHSMGACCRELNLLLFYVSVLQLASTVPDYDPVQEVGIG